jgi:hypothetical protein
VKRKSIIALVVSGALLAAVLFVWLRPSPVLPRSPLRDGGEFRVIQITYTSQPCDSWDHNIGAPKVRWWLYQHLPTALRRKVPEPSLGIGGQSSIRPVLSIWWAHIDPITRKPVLGEAGDVLMTDDFGHQKNLGWPDPAEDYRQIFIIDPPTSSKRLAFEFPIWGERVRFSLDNPAYRP